MYHNLKPDCHIYVRQTAGCQNIIYVVRTSAMEGIAMIKPELLAPAGNLEKLKVALAFGADAVYFSGPEFGLRQGADNFNLVQLKSAVQYVKGKQKKAYLTLNAMPHDEEIARLPDYLMFLETIQPHALIISDAGVLQLAKKLTTIDCHLSTQATVTNQWAASFWKKAGATRIVLARELSIAACQQIKKEAGIEVETFVHGSMCISYSGKCTISNYTAGRDSNRGGCVQSCRHTYEIKSQPTKTPIYLGNIMDAQDLMSLHLIPQMIEAQIDSLKIEGRMKSVLYVANVVRAYRQVIDEVWQHKACPPDAAPSPSQTVAYWEQRLNRVSNRGFSSGSLESPAGKEAVRYQDCGYQSQLTYLGMIKTWHKNLAVVTVKMTFDLQTPLIFHSPDGAEAQLIAEGIYDLNHKPIRKANPGTVILLKLAKRYPPLTIVSKESHQAFLKPKTTNLKASEPNPCPHDSQN